MFTITIAETVENIALIKLRNHATPSAAQIKAAVDGAHEYVREDFEAPMTRDDLDRVSIHILDTSY